MRNGFESLLGRRYHLKGDFGEGGKFEKISWALKIFSFVWLVRPETPVNRSAC